jgi:hypothetical protein
VRYFHVAVIGDQGLLVTNARGLGALPNDECIIRNEVDAGGLELVVAVEVDHRFATDCSCGAFWACGAGSLPNVAILAGAIRPQ